MKVLFCSTATNALGETYSIAVFALELMRKGHECFFLAPTLGKRYLLTFGFEESSILVLPGSMKEDLSLLKSNKTIFNKFLSYLKLDFVIVADWHEFKPNGNSNNNSYSIHWFDKKLRFGTFDHCGFAPDGEKVEIFINTCPKKCTKILISRKKSSRGKTIKNANGASSLPGRSLIQTNKKMTEMIRQNVVIYPSF